ncbi:MAG: hypothetical protein JNK90_02660 [Planctomycetaceae bacterium]|nr:hypothetical protein [Planctomycetaceae bacterium]
MIEQFNRLLQKFGHKMQIISWGEYSVEFEIRNFGVFMLHYESVIEVRKGDRLFTPNSRWIKAISEGKVRNDAGEMVTK